MYKIAKGAQDLVGPEYVQIQNLISRVEQSFQNAGGIPLDTPVFERTDVLLGKYGEEADTKLIYRLADEGGEALALRYDLTVPFTRYIKESGIKQMRRYTIGKVYRRDQPNKNAGRFREFIQADFDIFGEQQENMLAEATVLHTVCRIFDDLGLRYKILINDVRNLQYLLEEKLGIPEWRKCCPIIDKLDKQEFVSLYSEFRELDLSGEQITALQSLLEIPNPHFSQSITDFTNLQSIASVFGFADKLCFTNSLARGLDYYTGFIWEFKLEGIASTVSAGGRYDGLLGAPTVGISVGISRLASYLPVITNIKWKNIYMVTSIGTVSLMDKLRVVKKMQTITKSPVLYSLSANDKKLSKVITEACTSYNRYVVIVGDNELAAGKFIIKDLQEKTQELVDI